MRNLGYKTDCIFHRAVGSVTERSNYFCVRNPDNPTYRWGNLLIYPSAPAKGDCQSWITDFRKEFGEQAPHVTFGWLTDGIGELEPFKLLGFEFESLVVLQRYESYIDTQDLLNPHVQVREILSEQDWRKVVDLQYEVAKENTQNLDGYLEFLIRKYKQYRSLQHRGIGTWFGIFEGSQLVADMGLFWDKQENIARFQNIETKISHRRRGLCSTLMDHVMMHSNMRQGIRNWVVVASPGSGAEQLYLNKGFSRISFQQGVCLPKPLLMETYLELCFQD